MTTIKAYVQEGLVVKGPKNTLHIPSKSFMRHMIPSSISLSHLQVQVGEMEVIEWRLGTYRDLTISEGTGLLFQWDGPVPHNVIEMESPLSVTQDCKFVNLDSTKLGQVRLHVNMYVTPHYSV